MGFKKGNTFGKGRPSNGHAQLFRELVIDDIPDLVKDIMKDAKAGCLQSRKLIVERIFPVASSQMMELEKQMDEIRLMLEQPNELK